MKYLREQEFVHIVTGFGCGFSMQDNRDETKINQ
jgi:hypothetical protein